MESHSFLDFFYMAVFKKIYLSIDDVCQHMTKSFLFHDSVYTKSVGVLRVWCLSVVEHHFIACQFLFFSTHCNIHG